MKTKEKPYVMTVKEARREARALAVLHEEASLTMKPVFYGAPKRLKMTFDFPPARAERIEILPAHIRPEGKRVLVYATCTCEPDLPEARAVMLRAERAVLTCRYALPMPYGKLTLNIMRNSLTPEGGRLRMRFCFYGTLFELPGRAGAYRESEAA